MNAATNPQLHGSSRWRVRLAETTRRLLREFNRSTIGYCQWFGESSCSNLERLLRLAAANPYESANPEIRQEPAPEAGRRGEAYGLAVVAFVFHTLAIWGIACFHDIHIGAELKPTFRDIATAYGSLGLLAVAMIFALVPSVAYLVVGLLFARSATLEDCWNRVRYGIAASIGLTTALVVPLGLPIFTTG